MIISWQHGSFHVIELSLDPSEKPAFAWSKSFQTLLYTQPNSTPFVMTYTMMEWFDTDLINIYLYLSHID